MPVPRPCDIKEGHASCIEGVLVREYNQESCQEVLRGCREKVRGAANPDCEGMAKCKGKNESGRHCTTLHYQNFEEN